MDKGLKFAPDTIKLLEEKKEKTVQDVDIGKGFLEKTLKLQVVTTKINKQDHVTLRSFCTAKEAIHKVDRQPTAKQKICILHNT